VSELAVCCGIEIFQSTQLILWSYLECGNQKLINETTSGMTTTKIKAGRKQIPNGKTLLTPALLTFCIV
jgi:hypothetical protein